jgi:hypothetical protein
MPGRRTCRKDARHRPGDEAAVANDAVDAVVKAAYLELMAEGVYPSVPKIQARVKVADWRVDDARARLIATGAVPVDCRLPYATRDVADDPFEEQPDDPDADEIERRIAEVRAEKEAARAAVAEHLRAPIAKHHKRVHRLRAFA